MTFLNKPPINQSDSRQPVVWVVDSAYTGEMNARIGVAERLGYRYEVIPLPNGHAKAYQRQLWSRCPSAHNDGCRIPLIILSGTGEDTVCEIADLRALFLDRLLNVYLASILPDEPHPRLFDYDLIASPQLAGANVVTTLGVPHKVTQHSLKQAFAEHSAFFSELPRPVIGLLVGGNTRYCLGFDESYARSLARRVSQIVTSVRGFVIVSNSRRTPADALATLLREIAHLDYLFVDWQHSDDMLYQALLAHCDLFITTGDSLSMCSEVSFTGKPLLVDLQDNTTEIYHRQIIGKLLDHGAARLLSDRFDPWTYVPPDPTGAVAEAIKVRLSEG